MKYYSEIVKKLFDTEAELESAEAKVVEEQKKKDALKAKREERAKEVEKAFDNANDLLKKFCEDYGSFHMSVHKDKVNDYDSIFDMLLRRF